jgi:protein-tyrosine phosphatase
LKRVMFVCLGNICRSPLAEGAFRAHLERAGRAAQFAVASAGTANDHVGEAPDPRSVAEARRHGVDLTAQRGRHLTRTDLLRFDEVLCMDHSNLQAVRRLAAQLGPGERLARVGLLLDELDGGPAGAQVPDPYYGGPEGFAQVWRMVDEATGALLARL